MNRTMAFTVIVGIPLVLTLGGCAGRPTYSSQFFKFPELNVKSEAEVGQSMVSTARKDTLPAIVIDKDITHNGTGGEFVPNSTEWKLTISAGVLPMYMSDKEGTFYRMQEDVALTILGQPKNTTGGVFVPYDKSKPTEVYWGNPRNSFTRKARAVHPGIDFKLATYGEEWKADSFQRELVYSGISQNTLSILYREFSGSLGVGDPKNIKDTAYLRPRLSQELKYDLSQGDTIGYRGARFRVIKATNTSIKYEVLKHLD